MIRINVHINSGEGKNRISVNESFVPEQLGINMASMTAPPSFPKDEIQAITSSLNYTEKEKSEKISEIVQRFQAASASYTQGGNQFISDVIRERVVDFLVNQRGFSRTDKGANVPIVKETDLTVVMSSPPGSPDTIYYVNGQAVMG